MFLQIVINGLTKGCVYALIALGYSMVYGTLRFINFAHGDTYMWGACFALLFARMHIPFIPALLLTMICTGLLSVTIEFLCYRRLRNVPRVIVTASALGASIVLSNAALVLIGADVYTVPSFFEVRYFTLGTIVVNSMQFMLLGCAVILMLALTLFINKTKFGRAIRATSENMDVTSLMGINTNTIISLTFFIGAALAGAAGMLVGIYYDAVYSTMGYMAGMKAFTAAILGGIGSIPGAMLGSLVLGQIESFGTTYISSSMGPAISFAVLILVLLVRPTGFFGGGDAKANRV